MRRKLVKPLLIVISAPSGAGKTTLCDKLLQEFPEISYSVSCTTRDPRGEEEDGVDYFFMTEEGFRQKIANKELLEFAKVHGNYYGTLRKPVEDAFKAGDSVLMDIDVEGAGQVRDVIDQLEDGNPLKEGFVDIFISPPSTEELRRRLERRGEDTPEAIELRLRNADDEMVRAGEYSYHVVNENLDLAYRRLRDIILVAGGLL